MENDTAAKDKVASRFDFYRDGFRASVTLNLILALGVLGAAWDSLYAIYHQTPPQIIGIDDNDRVRNIIPIEDPRMTDADLKDWVVRQISQVCNIDWLHYREQLNAAMGGFTDAGWNGLYDALTAAKIPNQLRESRFVESCVPTKPPLIHRRGLIDGRPTEDIVIPYSIAFYGQAEERDRTMQAEVSVQVQNQDMAKYPRGVAIIAVQFKPFKESLDGE